jgi:tetratricopeptide (TPR) repeat protein
MLGRVTTSWVDPNMVEEKGPIAGNPHDVPQRDAPELFNEGAELFRGNRLAEAEALLARLLERRPDHADALHLLGLVAGRNGQPERAAELLSRALRQNVESAGLHRHLGNAQRDLGQFEQALASYDRALALRRDFRDAFVNRGAVLYLLGRGADALASFDAAVALGVDDAETHTWRASVLIDLGRPLEALESCDRALARSPDCVAAHANRAGALHGLGRFDEALASCDEAIGLDPDSADGHVNRGANLCSLGRPREALASLDAALAWRPDDAVAHNLRGAALLDLQRPEEALTSCARALELRPDFADAHSNRGIALAAMGDHDPAMASFDQAIALRPDAGEPRYNKAVRYLQSGRFAEGWDLYEWRHVADRTVRAGKLPGRLWDGQQDVARKVVYVYSEQGLGDTMQFCRYATLLKKRGAEVVLAVQPGLRSLLTTLDSAIEIISAAQTPPAGADFHCSLLSLPRAFHTRVDTIPAVIPYLVADPHRVCRWRDLVGMNGTRIGICWQGSLNRIDIGRSFPVQYFEAIAALPGVRLVSLQKGPALDQLRALTSAMIVEDPGEDFDAGPDAFLDAAAVIQCMDLVITSDTSIAHLAGALGRPAWVALKHNADWRWLLNRDDSPWYPSLRLFRQHQPGDWYGVFERMRGSVVQTFLESARGLEEHGKLH